MNLSGAAAGRQWPHAPIAPAAAYYHTGLREWILPYEAVRRADDRDATILEFCNSAYVTAATLGGWDRAGLERRAEPSH